MPRNSSAEETETFVLRAYNETPANNLSHQHAEKSHKFWIILAVVLVVGGAVTGLIYYFCTRAAQTSGSAAPEDNINDYILSKTLLPKHYSLTIQTFLPSEAVKSQTHPWLTYNGSVTIQFLCLNASEKIIINAGANLRFDENPVLTTTTDRNEVIPLESMTLVPQFTRLVLTSKQPLIFGTTYELTLNFSSPISNASSGYFFRSYLEGNETKFMTMTQFEPIAARKAFPCFDEPEYKTVFEVIMIHPSDLVALSNNKVNSSEIIAAGWNLTKFEPTTLMPTYLVAFFVGQFIKHSAVSKTGITVNSWTRPNLNGVTETAALLTAQLLDYFTDTLNMSYAYTKLDMVGVPGKWNGAMENWGLIRYDEWMLAFAPTYPESIKMRASKVIAHEVAHQWFGNLVTMRWWNDIFLNEAFAQFMLYISLTSIPLYNTSGYSPHDSLIFADNVGMKSRDAQPTQSRPIVLTPSNDYTCKLQCPLKPIEIRGVFNYWTYVKGGAMLHMLKSVYNNAFTSGVKKYMQMYQFKTAVYDDIWECMDEKLSSEEQGSGPSVKLFMDTWFLQSGYPIITVNIDYASRHMTLHQGRFSTEPHTKSNEGLKPNIFNSTWFVPVVYITDGNTTVSTEWLTPSKLSASLKLPKHTVKWVALNPKAQGYYRIHYDKTTWTNIREQMVKDHTVFDTSQKAQFIDDSVTYAKFNKFNVSMVDAISTTLYLKSELNPIPWTAAKFEYFDKMFYNNNYSSIWTDFMLNQTVGVYETFGWEDQGPSNNYLNHTMQQYALEWSCQVARQDCINEALIRYRTVKQDCLKSTSGTSSCSNVLADLRSLVYCMGVQHETDNDWTFIQRMSQIETDHVERMSLQAALTCTQNETYLQSINPLPKEYGYLVNARLQSDIMWMNTEADLKEFDNFTRTYHLPANQTATTRNLIVRNIDFMKLHAQSVANFMKDNSS